MAQNIVSSLFGYTPNDVYDAYAAQDRQAATALMNNPTLAQMGIYYGTDIGQGLGRGVASLLGAEDPRLVQAKVMAEAQQQGFDVTSPEGLQQLAKFFVQRGQPGLASQVAQQAQTISRAGAEEKLKEAQAYAAIKKADAEKLSNTARMLVEAGFEPNTPQFQAKMYEALQADITGKAKGSGSSTSVTIDAGSLAKAMGVDVGKQAAGIEGKYSALDSLSEAKKMLKSGIYAGAYGPEQMAAAKYTLGAAGSKQRVENTEQFMSHIGNVVIPRLQEFGGNDSVEELKYLQRVMGGEQRLEPKSLERILDSADRKINRTIERVQAQTKAAGTKAPPPLGPGASREAEAQKPRKVFNSATGKIEVQ